MMFLSDIVQAAKAEGWTVVAKQGTKMATMVECSSCKAKAMVLAKNGHSFTFCTCGKQHKV